MDEELSQEDAEKVNDAMDRMDGDDAPATEASTEPVATADNGDAPPANDADGPAGISQAQFVQLEDLASAADIPAANLEKMHDLRVNVQAVLGQTRMCLEEVLRLHQGSIVELEKLAGEPVEITANGKTIARAEVVVIDGNFGVKIIDIVGMRQKLSAAGG